MFKKRINKIFLIGNGFDLSHGLKTSYKDFIIDYLRLSYISAHNSTDKKYEDDCLIIKLCNDHYININELCSDSFQFKSYNKADELLNFSNDQIDFQLKAKNDFVRFILIECFESDWNGIEDAILKFVKASHHNLLTDKDIININRKKSSLYDGEYKNIKSLNSSVDCLKSKLIQYLKTQNSPLEIKSIFFDVRANWGKKVTENIQAMSNIDLSRDVLFLNFNYTNYIKNIIDEVRTEINENNLTRFDVINIHGNINDEINNIVFGVGDEQNNFYAEIETLYDDDWLKSMKSFHYFRTEYYSKLLGFIAKGPYEIHVLGHSCSITDRTLLNMLFENEYCEKIHVFHYKGMESYLTTAYNIARNFKDKVKLRSVLQHFNSDLKM